MLLIGLLFVRRPWVPRLLQAALVLGAIEWAYTLYRLVQFRIAMEQPFARMVVILGVVAGVTLCSALLFRTAGLREIYRVD